MLLLSILFGCLWIGYGMFILASPFHQSKMEYFHPFHMPLGIIQLIFLLASYYYKKVKLLENEGLLFLSVAAYGLFFFNLFISFAFIAIAGGADINTH